MKQQDKRSNRLKRLNEGLAGKRETIAHLIEQYLERFLYDVDGSDLFILGYLFGKDPKEGLHYLLDGSAKLPGVESDIIYSARDIVDSADDKELRDMYEMLQYELGLYMRKW